MRTLIKSPAGFHPAWTKPIVNGDDATVEIALSSSGDLIGR
jgi:hypothetical protein